MLLTTVCQEKKILFVPVVLSQSEDPEEADITFKLNVHNKWTIDHTVLHSNRQPLLISIYY